jgi:uncharacterized repeat protein (TIGR03803 family)
MRPNRLFQIASTALAVAVITLAMGRGAWASATETVLHGFSDNGTWHPNSLARDAAGNLYGISDQSIFELQRTPRGAFKEITLYTFPLDYNQGVNPMGPLVLDAAGNLYGVTQLGGNSTNCPSGCGSVFELSSGHSGWQASTLYSFTGFAAGDGAFPASGLIFDSAGNLYGVTPQGGAYACPHSNYGCGTVFVLSPDSGSWKETILHNFSVQGTEGWFPFGRLTLDSAGNLYGTTQRGTVFELSPGPSGWTETTLRNVADDAGAPLNSGLLLDTAGHVFGTTQAGVFELSPNPGGAFWKDRVVYNFSNANPRDLIFDKAGNLFGDTSYGGNGNGTFFELTSAGGTWNLTTLYTFTGGVDGASPKGLITDGAGNFYATSSRPLGNISGGLDEVLRLSLSLKGVWQATVLISGNFKDGFLPSAGLIFDAAGNLYGTTSVGGTRGFGTVFKMSPIQGGWKTSILYSFQGSLDGGLPKAGLVFDAIGNLYGTTSMGGNRTNCSQGCGTVFELSPVKSAWKEKTLYRFTGASDGGVPLAGLILDPVGNLYGTTSSGANNTCYIVPQDFIGCGTVFRLSPVNGHWHQSTLYSFTGGSDGGVPVASLILDSAGNLYGTAKLGGTSGANTCGAYTCGTVFKLSPGNGGWKQSTLYSFTGGSDGGTPVAGLTFDAAGNLYGTTEFGGTYYNSQLGPSGVVFKLTPSPSGWTESALHQFGSTSADGTNPAASLIFDPAGNLYGTTLIGGVLQGNVGGWGTVFQLTPSPDGTWAESVLYTLAGVYGGIPQSGVIMDAAGNLYGTSLGYGSVFTGITTDCPLGCGTVFEISGR